MAYTSFQPRSEEAGDTSRPSPWTPAPRPEWVEVVNELGADLEADGVQPIRLDADSLLEQAANATGLSDFGDDRFREPLGILTKSLDSEAALHFTGRIIARGEILRALQARLQLFDALKRHPEILEERIEAPIFVGGAGRSGTSIVQGLLAEDPAHRTPLGWEVCDPCPPAGESAAAREERIASWDHALQIWHRVTPEIATMHAIGGRVPAECPTIFAGEFLATYFTFSYNIPSYASWLAAADKHVFYEYHKKFLQLLQWQQQGRRWILKTPTHIANVATVLDVYPDARFAYTHRDPLKVVASLAGFHGTMVWMRSDRLPDIRAVMQGTSLALASLLDSTIQLQSEGVLRDEILFDILYFDFMQDPIGTIAKLYEHFGWEYTADTRERMRRHLAAHRQGAHGRYVYGFENTGLDPETERPRFGSYQAHQGVPSEI